MCRDTDCLSPTNYGPIRVLFSLWQMVVRVPLWLVLLFCSTCQVLKKPASLESFSVVQLPVLASEEREATVMAPPPCMIQQYHLASMTAWFSSTVISHCNLLPHVPSGCLPAVNSRHPPGIALQSLCSSSQLLHFLGDLHPCLGYVWLGQGLFVLSSLHLACHGSAASLSNSLKCFPTVPNNCPDVGI